jgi:DNA-binding GntR family transcriptional regulator
MRLCDIAYYCIQNKCAVWTCHSRARNDNAGDVVGCPPERIAVSESRSLFPAIDPGLPLGEAVYRALCRAMRDGLFRPGDRLREEEVAQRLEVSRTPVREALGRLLARRLVEHSGGRGLIIRRLSHAEVIELYAHREILEGAAARLAAQHASPMEFEALQETEDAFEKAWDDPTAMASLNRRLHEAIFAAARNRYLDQSLQDMQDSIALLGPTTFGVTSRPEGASVEHKAILTAIAVRDADAAEQAARLHIRGALRARLRLMVQV